MATNVGFNHKSKYDVPSSMLTVQNEPPPSDVIAIRLPVSTTTTRATKKRTKGGGAWKPPSTVMAGLMTTLTLLWFFGLHFSPDSFYMLERVHLMGTRTIYGQLITAIDPNLTVHLNFAGFFIVLSVLLGAFAMHPNTPLCGMLNPCCKMIPLFIFPGIASYMIFEGISVIWYIVMLFEQKHEFEEQLNFGRPPQQKSLELSASTVTAFSYIMVRLFLDMLCCLALAFLLLYFAIKSLGQPPPTMPDASFGCNSYFMPMPSAMFSQDPSASTLVVSQAGAQQAPVYNKPGTVYVPMQRTPLMPNLPPTRTTKPQAVDEPKTKQQQQDVERQQQDASGRQQRRSGRGGEDSGRQPVTLTTQMVEVTKAKTAAELAKGSGRSSETNTKEGPTADSFMAYDDDEEKKKKF